MSTCKGGYTAQALMEGSVQRVAANGTLITLSRSIRPSDVNTPFHVIVWKYGQTEFSKQMHWLADARAEFTRQIRYHLGEQMNLMARDGRFTCNREWTGKPYQVWVCRFAGEWYTDGITKAEALMDAWEKKYGE